MLQLIKVAQGCWVNADLVAKIEATGDGYSLTTKDGDVHRIAGEFSPSDHLAFDEFGRLVEALTHVGNMVENLYGAVAAHA